MAHRFYLQQDLSSEQIVITDSDFCHQVYRVLKFKPGEQIVLFNGNGKEVFAVITQATPKQVVVKAVERQTNENEPQVNVALFVATIKRDNLEWVAQKTTEVGVSTIVPMTTERTVKLGLNRKRLETIIKEAAEQSGRAIVPALAEQANFDVALRGIKKFDASILFDKGGESFSKLFSDKIKSIALFIGPEGGFSPAEVEQAKNAGCKIASLGNLTLRAETAAIIASYLVANL